MLALMICSCSARPPATSPATREHARISEWGNTWDMTVLAGPHDGYVVIAPCNMNGLVGVHGTGSLRAWPAGVKAREVDMAAVSALRADITNALGPLTAGVGFGVGCRAGELALILYVDRYGDVDPAVDRLGAFLREHGRGDDVTINLVGHAEPL